MSRKLTWSGWRSRWRLWGPLWRRCSRWSRWWSCPRWCRRRSRWASSLRILPEGRTTGSCCSWPKFRSAGKLESRYLQTIRNQSLPWHIPVNSTNTIDRGGNLLFSLPYWKNSDVGRDVLHQMASFTCLHARIAMMRHVLPAPIDFPPPDLFFCINTDLTWQ